MSKANQLRAHDVHNVHRLIGECRDLGTDPMLWHARMFEGLASLIGATAVTGGEGRWRRPREAPAPASGYSVGLDATGQQRLMAYVRDGAITEDPVFQALRRVRGRLLVKTRRQIVPDHQWYRSRTFNEYLRPIGFDHQLTSVCYVRDDTVSVVTIHRGHQERDFSEREQGIQRFFHVELGRLVGTALASVFDPDPLRLPRRQRETLACLLEGDSEKQVAARLGVSQSTAHQYVTALYRQFRVRSRAELLAHFLRRLRATNRMRGS